jgi:uncharacterized membrane protein YfcA
MDLSFGWPVLLTFVIALLASVLSGMGGGGGGFIITPYFLFLGMAPANALATSKLGGVGVSFGSLTALHGKGVVQRKYLRAFLAITFVCALISAWLVPQIDPGILTKVIGVALLAMTPTLFIKRAAFEPGPRTKPWIVVGFILYTIFTFLLTLIGTGMGMILVLILMFLFGMNALEASATKRVTQSIQAVLLLVLLAVQGLVFWWHGIALLVGSSIGSHIGTHIAIRRGASFVKIMLAIVMVTSGIALLL